MDDQQSLTEISAEIRRLSKISKDDPTLFRLDEYERKGTLLAAKAYDKGAFRGPEYDALRLMIEPPGVTRPGNIVHAAGKWLKARVGHTRPAKEPRTQWEAIERWALPLAEEIEGEAKALHARAIETEVTEIPEQADAGGRSREQREPGVTLQQLVDVLYAEDEDKKERTLSRWNKSRVKKPVTLGLWQRDRRQKLYRPTDILEYVKKSEGYLPGSQPTLLKALTDKASFPEPK